MVSIVFLVKLYPFSSNTRIEYGALDDTHLQTLTTGYYIGASAAVRFDLSLAFADACQAT